MNPMTMLCARLKRYCLQSLWLFAFLVLLGLRASALPDLQGWNGVYNGVNYNVLPFAIGVTSANWGDGVPIQFTVANLTSSAAGAFNVGIYISTSVNICSGSTYLLTKVPFSSGLGAWSYSSASGTVYLPTANPLPGQPTAVYFGMIVDCDHQITESENNQCNLGNGYDLQAAPVTITNPQPHIQVTTSTPTNTLTVAFGSVVNDGPGNAVGVQTVTLVNQGKASLTVSNITLSGSSYFSILDIRSSIQSFILPSSLPRTITQDTQEVWVVTLQFDPATSAAATGTLTIRSNDPSSNTVSVALTGTGVPVAQIALTTPAPTGIDFGSVVQAGPGGSSATRTISIQNNGTGPLTVSQNGIALLTGTYFSLVSVTSSTRGTINLAAGSNTIAAQGAEIWNIVVQFAPTVLGSLSDGLSILSNDPNNPTFVVSLSGQGITPMHLVVTDPIGATNNLAIQFPAVHASGKQQAGATLTLSNSGEAPLTIRSNGLTLATGTQFRVASIISDIAGPIDLAVGAAQIAATNQETWTATIVFEPSVAGALTDTLTIYSNDPVAPAVPVALSGVGTNRPALFVTPTNLVVNFGAVLNDGPGGSANQQIVTLTDIGTQPLIVAQNGLSITGSAAFSIVSVVSSTNGPINVASANASARTLLPAQNDTWTVTIAFDPTANGGAAGALNIASNDPQWPLAQVSLVGTGATPTITMSAPAIPLNVSAGSVFTFTWQASYLVGDATIALYLDTGTNPANGLIPIASGISMVAAGGQYQWRVDPSLVGTNYYVYATITAGSVTNSSYAPGTLTIDPVGAFQLTSPSEVTSPNYAYQYIYNGQVYQGITQLVPGNNTVTVSNAVPGGGTATFQFGVQVVPSLTDIETTQYNTLNQVVQTQNGNGIITTYTYDQMGRLVQRASSNGAIVTYAYDVLGRRTSMTDYTGTTVYQWDDLDRLTAVTTSGGLTLSYQYDLAGHCTAIVYPDGETVQYTYDNAGRMLTVNNVTRNLLFTYTYNPANGLLQQLTRPNGINTLYSYDGMGRLTELHHQTSAGTLVADFLYGLDAAGKTTNLVTTLPGNVVNHERYSYDRFDRVSQVIYGTNGVINANSPTVSYTYDGNNNRLTMTTTISNVVTQVLTYTYGNDNRLVSITDQNGASVAQYVYDAAGNCIEEITPQKTTFYSYDERNLLTGFVDGTNQVVFAYNGDGQRVAKTVNGTATTYVVDANRSTFEAVQERGATGLVSASYTFGAQRLATYSGNSSAFELPDGLGSVRYIATTNGTVSSSYSYDVFGTATVLTGNANSFTFTGQRLDPETGLIFLRARYYAPDVGRFISKDPLGVSGGINGYVYCGDDVVNNVDPSGLVGTTTGAAAFLQGAVDVALEPILEVIDVAQLKLLPASANITLVSQLGKSEAAQLAAGQSPGTVAFNATSDIVRNTLTLGTYGMWNSGSTLVNAYNQGNISIDQLQIGLLQIAGGAAGGAALASLAANETTGNPMGYDINFNQLATASQGKWTAFEASSADVGFENSPQLSSAYNVFQGSSTYGGLVLANLAPSSISEAVANTAFNTQGLPDIGGVLLDEAATLVGSNLSDIRGAMYDPVSGQFVILGTAGAAPVAQINLDYLYTALQAIYGSAVPPFVTLNPPASAYTQWINYGNGNGIFGPGQLGGFILRYNPTYYNVVTNIDVTINTQWSGTNYTWKARFKAYNQGCLETPVFSSWLTPPPAGVSLSTSEIFYKYASCSGEDLYTYVTLYNGSTNSYIVTGITVAPDRQLRAFGGRVENTQTGWVMEEADRVMKCLSVGRDNLLTNITYTSTNVAVTGFQNMAERLSASGGVGSSIRFWFTPDEMTLQRSVDPNTGLASIVFTNATVMLNTESYMMGLPQPAAAKAFADHFTANYDAFAALSFPCVDPNDPTGQNIVSMPIFSMLREVMQAVSLARFFLDNSIPVDMWWLNSWQPPVAYAPNSVPTAYNQEAGIVVYGGVQINLPNSYVPSATAQDVAALVQSARPSMGGNPNGDIQTQVWNTVTSVGTLTAVALHSAAEPQDADVDLAEKDLSFASPGALPLRFTRYYHSGWLGQQQMGPGWRYTPFVLEFARPSWYDQNSLMFFNGTNVWVDSNYDTRLRSGALRMVDLRTKRVLDFNSSLTLGYAVDNLGNPSITVSGLGTNAVPTFTAGQRQNGSTLAQLPGQLNYQVTTPTAEQLVFDSQGRLLQTIDRYGYHKTYTYSSSGALLTITDDASQSLALAYDAQTNYVTSVTGPASEQVTYSYTNGCLQTATHVRSGATVSYQYNASQQLVQKTLFNGLNAIASQPDLKGRASVATDVRSNSVQNAFTQDSAGTVRTTQTSDLQITDPSFVPRQQQYDRTGRLLASRDATGAQTYLNYDEGSLAPNYVDLPIAGRPTISITRNAYSQPTNINDPGNIGAQDVTATYDPVTAQLQQTTDELGRATALAYNSNQSVSRVRRYLGGKNVDTQFGYTASGALQTVINPLGITAATYYRDAVDRVTNVVDATGISLGYQYDSLGRISKVSDPRLSGPVQYVYDNFDRVTQIIYPVGSVSFTYDPVKGWLMSQTDQLGRVTNYVRDPNTGDILQTVDVVSNGANRVTAMTYNRFGQLATVTPSGAQPTALTYDQLGRPLGSTGIGANPPGAPKALQSNNATNGVPTTATNHVFTWGAPDSDSGIAGYSYAFDQAPDETIDTTAATATWTNVAVGTHTFQVMAKANNGLWGEPAVFNLIVQPLTGYALWRTQQFSPEEAANDSISGPTADPDGDGSPNLLKYALGMAAKSPSMTGLPVLTVPGNFLVFEFARNLNATDVKYEVQGSTDLATWTTLAGREAGGSTWTIDVGGTTVSDASGSVSVTDGSAPISNTGRRFLRLKVSLTQ